MRVLSGSALQTFVSDSMTHRQIAYSSTTRTDLATTSQTQDTGDYGTKNASIIGLFSESDGKTMSATRTIQPIPFHIFFAYQHCFGHQDPALPGALKAQSQSSLVARMAFST